MTLPKTMTAMVTMGHGDIDQMVLHRDWPRPEPAADEVLIRVGACGAQQYGCEHALGLVLQNRDGCDHGRRI